MDKRKGGKNKGKATGGTLRPTVSQHPFLTGERIHIKLQNLVTVTVLLINTLKSREMQQHTLHRSVLRVRKQPVLPCISTLGLKSLLSGLGGGHADRN